MDYRWKDEYKLSIDTIDEQHKSLFEAIEGLEKLINSEEDQANPIDASLSFLVRYTDYHFNAEEKLLERKGFPDLARHRQLHKDLKDNVLHFLKEQEEGTLDIGNFLVFLQYWLVKHILVEDKKFADFLNKKKE